MHFQTHDKSFEIKSQTIQTNCEKGDPREPLSQNEMNINSAPTPASQVEALFELP